MWRAPAVRRREHFWGVAAAVALCWPDRVAGAFDGFPFDKPLEALAIGVVFPALWWFAPAFLGSRTARVAIVGLLLCRVFSATTLVQEGWCVSFETAAPIVRDGTTRPRSWDVRADWRSVNPTCSAIMTRAYVHSRDLPAFFLNLSPPDDNLPQAEDRPPLMVFRMRVHGFVHASTAGALAIETTASMKTQIRVNGVELPLSTPARLDPGVHEIEVDATLTGNQWRLRPAWDGIEFGAWGFPEAFVAPPSQLDTAARPLLSLITFALAGMLLLAWLVTWLASTGDPLIAATGMGFSVALAFAGSQHLTVTTTWAVSTLVIVTLLDVPTRLRNIRGIFLLVGAPWLTFVAAAQAHHIGRFMLLDAGNDWWTFQRYAYRIYLQGYWLEGGQPTFWFQPFYRWIAGALHIAFGDSHFGEFVWDGACVLAVAMLAYYLARLTFGFRAGVLAAVLTLTLVMRGPGWLFIGRGLSEWTAAGLLSLAAQFALRARRRQFAFRPGAVAMLGTFTRLNHLPMTLGVAAFALRSRTRVRDLVHPARVTRTLRPGVPLGVAVAVGAGLLLFAWRTWYYTGVFSVTHGTSFGMLTLSQPGQSFGDLMARIADSLAMLLSMSDPPRYNHTALPLMIAAAVSLAALLGVPIMRNLPASAVLFFVAGCVGALVARGTAYPGRFSLHLLGIASGLTVCALCLVLRAAGARQRQRLETLSQSASRHPGRNAPGSHESEERDQG
jgi:hypothetical protein